MASVINANSFAALGAALKYHYSPAVDDLIRVDAPFYGMFAKKKDFRKGFGGRALIWEGVMDRAWNVGTRDEESFLPGFGGSTNDDLDRVDPQEFALTRATTYAATAFTSQQMADVHKAYERFKGWGFSKHIKGMQDDLKMKLEHMALGDKTGVLGVVVSASLSGGNTVCVLQPASQISLRGIHGTARLYKNMKVSVVRAGDFATSARLAKIHSNLGGLGTGVFKVVATSGIHDVSSAPTVTLSGDLLSAGTAIAAGDVIVDNLSRDAAAAGGQSATEALKNMDGVFSFIDDATLTTTLYGKTRSSYTQMNSQTNLSTTVRPLSWQILQVLFDKLNRRRGDDANKIESEYMMFTERSIATAYVASPGEGQKEYIQEEKAKKMVAGFKDVGLAFLGNDTVIPWVRYNTVPYGHCLLMRPDALEVMWDIEPSIIDDNGITMHKIDGKAAYTVEMQAVGNFRIQEPWLDGRLSGLQGQFA